MDNLFSQNSEIGSSIGYGGFKFFSKMGAIVIAGTGNNIKTQPTGLGISKIGFVNAYQLGEPRAEWDLTVSQDG